ncbi:hypothetical protein ACFPOE_21990 [Caenimonas terrae]|uniref:DUF2269 family protein n=1 Tax=Caenimonas terrae TaxID=696074 RepID=A0ABW0NJM8_9BURK
MGEYFWLFCGAWCGLGGAAWMRVALRKKVEAGEFTSDEVSSFTLRYAIWIFLPCLALWLLQRAAGPAATPEYFKWQGTPKLLAFALQLFVWSALLYWVFLGNGAATMSRYMRATQRSSSLLNGPRAVQVWSVAAVLAGLFVLLGPYA